MRHSIFSIPIFISQIDTKKLNLKSKELKKTWLSQTISNYESSENKNLDNKTGQYLLSVIHDAMHEYLEGRKFSMSLKDIWINVYEQNDYQETHTHPGSHFSFTIYKKIDRPHTIFFHPVKNIIQSYYHQPFPELDHFYAPNCKQGDIIIFPSFLEHMVTRSSACETISGNILINYE